MELSEKLEQSWLKGEPITFSYSKKYWINYGHKLIDEAGEFSGKLVGYGFYNVPDEKDLAYNKKIGDLFYKSFPSKLVNQVWNHSTMPQWKKNLLVNKFISPPFQWILKLKKKNIKSHMKKYVNILEKGKNYAVYYEDILIKEEGK